MTQPQVYVRGFIRFVLYETDLEMPEFSVHPNTTPTEYIILPWTGPPHKTDCFCNGSTLQWHSWRHNQFTWSFYLETVRSLRLNPTLHDSTIDGLLGVEGSGTAVAKHFYWPDKFPTQFLPST